MAIDKGNFTISFHGPMASGKTVAAEKVKKALEAEGYEVEVNRHADREGHVLSVCWAKD